MKQCSCLRTARGNRRKFTLTELLIVIAIIAILASMLLPVLNKVRQKSHGTQCLSNLKQQMLGFSMYIDTYGNMPYHGETAYKLGLTTGYDYRNINYNSKAVGLGLLAYTGFLGSPADVLPRGNDRPKILNCPVNYSGNGNFNNQDRSDYIMHRDSYYQKRLPPPSQLKNEVIFHCISVSDGWQLDRYPEDHSGSLATGHADGHVAMHKYREYQGGTDRVKRLQLIDNK